MTRIVCSVAAFLLLAGAIASGQNAGSPAAPRPGLPARDNAASVPPGTARLQGRVLTTQGQPLRRARVMLLSNELNVRRYATTDAAGDYAFAEVPDGRFTITASKGGYVSLQYGQRRPFEPGRPLAVTGGQILEKVDIRLPRGSVIAGRITDEYGEPLTGARVEAQRYQFGADGVRTLTGVGPFVQSDDRGEFRVYGLMPGEYVISASLPSPGNIRQGTTPDATEEFATSFYPGTPNPAEAQPVAVGLGEEMSITLALRASRMSRISGTIVDSQGRPAAGATLTFESFSGGGSRVMFGDDVDADGSFSVSNVPTGEHFIQVRGRTAGSDAIPEWATVPVTVGTTDINGLRIALQPPGIIKGSLVFEGTAPRTGGTAPLRVIANAAQPQRQTMNVFDSRENGLVDADGNFEIRGVTGTVLLRAISLPPAWAFKSATLDGDDVADRPLEMTVPRTVSGVRIVLTDRLTDLSGSVSDSRGERVREYTVVIAPVDEKVGWAQTRYTRLPRPDQDGRFRVRGLPEGRYYVVAVEAFEDGRQWDPGFQRELRTFGKSITLTAGQGQTVDLTLANIP